MFELSPQQIAALRFQIYVKHFRYKGNRFVIEFHGIWFPYAVLEREKNSIVNKIFTLNDSKNMQGYENAFINIRANYEIFAGYTRFLRLNCLIFQPITLQAPVLVGAPVLAQAQLNAQAEINAPAAGDDPALAGAQWDHSSICGGA